MWKVYIAECELGKKYVGCTSTTMEKRMAVHRYKKKPFCSLGSKLTVVFETESYDQAAQKERELILLLETTNPEKGYNRRFGDSRSSFPKGVLEARSRRVRESGIFSGSNNPMFGRKHSDDTKKKMSVISIKRNEIGISPLKGVPKKPESVLKQSESLKRFYKENPGPMIGRRHSEETRAKMSEKQRERAAQGDKPFLGRKHSDESKRRMSETKRMKKLSSP